MHEELTPEEVQDASDIIMRCHSATMLLHSMFSPEELDLVERSIDAVEEERSARDVLASVFGVSSMSQQEQNQKANIPVIRALISLHREIQKMPDRAKRRWVGEELFGELEAW